MFDKILIANRGEIACRVIRTAKRLGVQTVAVYSEADKYALHVKLADESYCIGPAESSKSYLNIGAVLEVAAKSGAQAIHPGYGFLSENADFARACQSQGVVFIGPPASAIEAMAVKSAAKQIVGDAGVPLLPGYHGDDQSAVHLREHAQQIGYPVMLKAVSGGGGKGMRLVREDAEFDAAYESAVREAESSFADGRMLVERFIEQPRHVEVQVFCDQHGNAVYLGERDCSVQRRHQKVIEEAPAPGMTPELRQKMGEAAVNAARSVDYVGAGTVEFLMDAAGDFYFMEMNTRLQVEHPVTEKITDQDLVHWQLLVASGGELPLVQEQIEYKGHAFEARIYAEDPNNDFLPVTGTLTRLATPDESQFVRVDSGVIEGDEISPYYDPMIAKLVVWDEDRNQALSRMNLALQQYELVGTTTNADFLYTLFNHPRFRSADVDTGFIDQHLGQLIEQPITPEQVALVAAHSLFERNQQLSEQARVSPWAQPGSWRMNQQGAEILRLTIGNEDHAVTVHYHGGVSEQQRFTLILTDEQLIVSIESAAGLLRILVNDQWHELTALASDNDWRLFTNSGVIRYRLAEHLVADNNDTDDSSLQAPMNGKVISLAAVPGQTVSKGDPLLVMEAMKMEHTVPAPFDGNIIEYYFQPGDLVAAGADLLELSAIGAEE